MMTTSDLGPEKNISAKIDPRLIEMHMNRLMQFSSPSVSYQ